MDLFTTRPATAADHNRMFDVHRRVFKDHIEQLWGWDENWQRSNFEAECAACSCSILEEGDVLAGYVQTTHEPNGLRLRNIAIDAAFQGRGFGTSVVEGLQKDAARRGVAIHLSVFTTNARAAQFYLRLGFRETERDSKFIGMTWTAA